MPTVRSYGQRQIATTPLPGVQKRGGETPTSMGAGVEEARAGKFGAVSDLGATITKIGQTVYDQMKAEERLAADQTAVTKASNQYSDWKNKFLYDTETGVFHRQGEAALGIPEEFATEHTKVIGEIGKTMKTPEQRLAWERISANEGQTGDLLTRRYTAEQIQTVHVNEAKAAVGHAAQDAARLALSPDLVGGALDKGEAASRALSKLLGQGKEEADAAVLALRSGVHVAVIDQLIAADQDQKAKIYFEGVNKEIDAAQLGDVMKKVETASTLATGLRTSDQIWKDLGPKGSNDPINIADMESRAREQFKDDPKTLAATIGYLRERKAGVDAQRQDQHDYTLGTVSKAVSDDRGLAEIHAMPEYLALSEKLQGAINDAVLQRAIAHASQGYYAQTRNATLTGIEDSAKTRAGWAKYWELSVPSKLTDTSEDALNALRLTMGDALVNQLLTQKRGLDKGEAVVRDANIDVELFNTLATQSGMKVYGTLTDDQKSANGQLLNSVNNAIDAEQRRTGKALDRAAKEAITKDILGKKVMLNYWGTDPERVAALVTDPADRAKAYVPIAKIPSALVDEVLTAIKGFGPATATMTPTEMRARYQDRIEHAYAIKLLGGSRDEQLAILKGAP